MHTSLVHPHLLNSWICRNWTFCPLPLPQTRSDGTIVILFPRSIQRDGDLPLPILSVLHVSSNVSVFQYLCSDYFTVSSNLQKKYCHSFLELNHIFIPDSCHHRELEAWLPCHPTWRTSSRGEDKLLLSRKSHRKIGQFPKLCSLGW